MLEFMPRLATFLIPSSDYDDNAIAEIMLMNFQGYIDLIFREVGAQSVHIIVNLDLRKIDPSEYLTDEYSDKLGESVYNKFIDRLTAINP